MRHESSDILRGTLELLILRTLAREPMHGWGISRRIRDESRGILDVNQGSLYPALQRLEQREWIVGEWRASDNNRRARYYAMTAKGRRAIGVEIAEWREFVAAVEMLLASLACMVLAAPARAVAQDPSSPAVLTPASVLAKGLPVRSDTMDGYLLDGPGAGQRYGWYVYALARATVAGRPGYLVTATYTGGHGNSDTLAVDAATLAPVWRRMHAWRDSAAIRFDGRHVTGWAARENERRVTVDYRLSEHAFDSALLPWVVATMPLAAGSRVTVTTFSMWSNSERTRTASVVGSETLRSGDRQSDAWVVRLTGSPSDTTDARYWIARGSGELLQSTAHHQRSREVRR
jgi:PadR family transcriptional regulator PadR